MSRDISNYSWKYYVTPPDFQVRSEAPSLLYFQSHTLQGSVTVVVLLSDVAAGPEH